MAALKSLLTFEFEETINDLLRNICQWSHEDALYSTNIRGSVEYVQNHSVLAG